MLFAQDPSSSRPFSKARCCSTLGCMLSPVRASRSGKNLVSSTWWWCESWVTQWLVKVRKSAMSVGEET